MKSMILFLVSLLLGLLLGIFVGKEFGTHLIRFEAAQAGAGEWQVDKITGEKNFVWLSKQSTTKIFSGPYSDGKQPPIPPLPIISKIPQPYGYGK